MNPADAGAGAEPQQTSLSEIDEFALIRQLAAGLPPVPAGWIGVGDDAAVGTFPPGQQALTTVDLLVEGVHFRLDTTPPAELGHKALAVNLSDIAAMGGTPLWAVVGIAAPPSLPVAWLEAFYDGLGALARATGVAILGGDTVRASGGLTISITVVGACERPLLRSVAEPGDVVFVTGPCGLAAAGLWCLEQHVDGPAEAVAAQRKPRPLLAAGRALVQTSKRVALIDDSDGLARSASAIAEASGVEVWLETAKIPLAEAAKAVARLAEHDPLDWALYGGEDYGLVGCVALEDWLVVCRALATVGVAALVVGGVRAGEGRVCLRDVEGRERVLENVTGYAHFKVAGLG